MAGDIYAVTALDHPDSAEKRTRLRPDHLRWIEAYAAQIRVAGPLRAHKDGPVSGSLLFVQAQSEDALRVLLAADPYAKGGLFASVTIAHFTPVAGTWLGQ